MLERWFENKGVRMGSIAARPVDWLRGWNVRRSLRDPQTRQPALDNILGRIPINSALAIDVLSHEAVSQADRIKVLSAVLTSNEFVQAGKVYEHPYHLPKAAPRLFSVLASRSDQIVSALNGFWRHFEGETRQGSTDRSIKSAYAGKKLQTLHLSEYLSGTGSLFPDHNQVVGYQIGEHKFYLISGPITPCSWERGDAITALRYSLPSLQNILADVESTGFYSRFDIESCVKAMSGVNFDHLRKLQGQGGIIIEFKRDDFSAPLEVKVISASSRQRLELVEFTYQPELRQD